MNQPELSIEVKVAYLPQHSQPEQGDYQFSYTIRIINVGDTAAQIIARRWLIEDAKGTVMEVRGLGVVGKQPMLASGEVFEYTSGCKLETATGYMQGHYVCVTEEGDVFESPIPRFLLSVDGPEWQHQSSAATNRVLH